MSAKFFIHDDDGWLVEVQLSPEDKEIVIPDNVHKIIGRAFMDCKHVTSVVIPDSVESIGENAFSGCSKLKSIVIGKNVKKIAEYAFSYCNHLETVVFSGNTISLGMGVFIGCKRLKSITGLNTVDRIELDVFGRTLKSVENNYKAFSITKDGRLKCLNKYYEVGKKSRVRGELTLCANGIHYCTNLLDIFHHYWGTYGKDFVIGECKVSEEIRHCIDRSESKKCARWIIPNRLLTAEEVAQLINTAKPL